MGCCTNKSSPRVASLHRSQSNNFNSGHLPQLEPARKIFDPTITYEIHSKIPKESVKYKPTIPEVEERGLYKYECPLCFRYFANMLQCSKCLNYTCRLCGDDIGVRSQEVLSIARCPFCDISPFVLEDVDENKPVKKYTDTPYSSCASRFRFTRRQNLQPKAFDGNVNNEIKEDEQISAFYSINDKKFSSTFPAIRLEIEDKDFRNSTRSLKDNKQ